MPMALNVNVWLRLGETAFEDYSKIGQAIGLDLEAVEESEWNQRDIPALGRGIICNPNWGTDIALLRLGFRVEHDMFRVSSSQWEKEALIELPVISRLIANRLHFLCRFGGSMNMAYNGIKWCVFQTGVSSPFLIKETIAFRDSGEPYRCDSEPSREQAEYVGLVCEILRNKPCNLG